MSNSKIQWTDKVWNPVTGCTKVSSGCANCYAERLFPRAYANSYVEEFRPGPGDTRMRKREFTDVVCHPDRLDNPLHWKKPRLVFVNSMSDLFHEDVPDEFIDKVFAVMALKPQHKFQVLTKRPERMRDYFDYEKIRGGGSRFDKWEHAARKMSPALGTEWLLDLNQKDCFPLPNVWLGVSCEDQKTANERIPILLETPAAIRFVSAEPLLDKINFSKVDQFHALGKDIDWVIVGGESGPKGRPWDITWIRQISDQCKASGTACFVKQLGSFPKMGGYHRNSISLNDRHSDTRLFRLMRHPKGGDIEEWPEDLRVREWPEMRYRDGSE